jgi:hypothetical protein
MKRDMELIRLLLLQQESGEAPRELADYSRDDFLYNLAQMGDAGLICASFSPDAETPDTVLIHRLTWAGHDFLDATRDSKIWKKAKDHIIKPGVSWTSKPCLSS